jgi:hypothetical protein
MDSDSDEMMGIAALSWAASGRKTLLVIVIATILRCFPPQSLATFRKADARAAAFGGSPQFSHRY